MFKPPPHCEEPETVIRETIPYYEYYLGEKDDQDRRHGVGQNCWSSAESIEWYCGRFLRDTMHGTGEYRCRYKGRPGLFVTYEGRLYANRMHGYGALSYPDGMVFTGLFNNDVRYGPGIETFANVTANVGLWRGPKLVRLAWRPEPAAVPDYAATSAGQALVDPHRVVLQPSFKTISKVNQAVEYLKRHGSDPKSATQNWTRLYPKHCTDVGSRLCHVDLFDYEYYEGKVYSLKELDTEENNEDLEIESQNSMEYFGSYYAWNNGAVTIDIMKHSFKHEKQREETQVNLEAVLNGPRTHFKPPAIHELDCRTLLLACYMGRVADTTYLVNQRDVDPNIADMLGNSAVMYAVCGDQGTLINFLVEAGADVNGANDSCCTPLAVALIRLLCATRDVPMSGMMQALVPPLTVPVATTELPAVLDWKITRGIQPPESTKATPLKRTQSKLNKLTSNVKNKSLISVKDAQSSKIIIDSLKFIEDDIASKLYRDINSEYIIKVSDLLEEKGQPVEYLFKVNNIVEQINTAQARLGPLDKNNNKSKAKIIMESTKPSKEVIWQNTQKDEVVPMTTAEIRKTEILDGIKLTIFQLLENGAKPSLVKCPQPPLFMAILAGCPELVEKLARHGAAVNEVYAQHLNYTPLDLAISQPLNQSTLDMVQTLLSVGANADHRLTIFPSSPRESVKPETGPTLLHYVLARRVEEGFEEEIRRQMIHLLIEYNCNPLKRYKGHSALSDATRNLELLDVIIKNPKTDLNAAIDDSNQTILVKMFHMPYFKTLGSMELSQTLTNLLLFGANPLIMCECEGVKYENLFVMAKHTVSLLHTTIIARSSPTKKLEAKPSLTLKPKGKKVEPTKKEETLKSDDLTNFQRAIDLMTECSRILYIRWLQTQLAKEIIPIIDRYKHRHWSMIIKECKHKKAASLWITAQRCYEIWGHLKTTQKRIYHDTVVLWDLLCISHFLHMRSVTKLGFDKVTAAEKCETETYVRSVLRDNKKNEMVVLPRYVRPELFVNADAKFNVCFECFLPLTSDRIQCTSCKFVSFCNMDCLKESIEKSNGHACNDYLVLKYLPQSPRSLETSPDDDAMPREPSGIK